MLRSREASLCFCGAFTVCSAMLITSALAMME
jgi:hypothetical protein